jgi:hypothetical protein
MTKPYMKDPDAVLDYVWDWSQWLDGDIILSHNVFAQGGLTVNNTEKVGGTIKAWIKDGIEGIQYWVTCRVTTVGGRTDDRTIQILVRSR